MTTTQRRENEVIEALQQQLANTFLLYLNYKKYHWQSYGPLFRDLHELFDEQGQAVFNTIDELGERVRILDGEPLADARQFGERGTVTIAAPNTNMRDMVSEARTNAQRVIGELRQAVEVANSAGDPGTADLFTRIVQIHEKHEWFLRQILAKQDGLQG